MTPSERLDITASDVHKRFASGEFTVRALRGVDLEVHSGEFVAVLGPSGAGKSTLLRLLAGLDHPTSGTIDVGGRSLSERSQRELAGIRRKHVGYVVASAGLLAGLTSLENVALPAIVAGSRRPIALQRATELLDLFGISRHADALPAALAPGDRQRVAFARALANEPTVLLADEPTGELDSESAGELLELLRRLNVSGQTVLLATHDRAVAASADRAVSMLDGAVVG